MDSRVLIDDHDPPAPEWHLVEPMPEWSPDATYLFLATTTCESNWDLEDKLNVDAADSTDMWRRVRELRLHAYYRDPSVAAVNPLAM